MNSKGIQEYKNKLSLTNDQRAIIVGLLLGDGHLETQNDGRTYRLKVEHSLKQEDYVQWLYDYFKEWAPAGLYYKKRTDGQQSVGFTTYSHGSFRFYGQQFYRGKKKVIPRLITTLLQPLSIAIWFMDDGSRKSLRHATYIIHTLGFEKKELTRLQSVLLRKFKVKTMLHRQKSVYWRLYIPSHSARMFKKIVEPYVQQISSMTHKLSNIMPKR